jgi:hypothetical protein
MNRFILEYRADERIAEFVRNAETAHGRRHEPFANIRTRMTAALKLSPSHILRKGPATNRDKPSTESVSLRQCHTQIGRSLMEGLNSQITNSDALDSSGQQPSTGHDRRRLSIRMR